MVVSLSVSAVPGANFSEMLPSVLCAVSSVVYRATGIETQRGTEHSQTDNWLKTNMKERK